MLMLFHIYTHTHTHTHIAPPSSSSSPKRVEKPAVEKEPSPPPAKKETHKATKLLDELFRKTKTTPSIYWLPLTEAQVNCVFNAREFNRSIKVPVLCGFHIANHPDDSDLFD